MNEPKRLDDDWNREVARRTRDRHWSYMEKMAERGKLWICPWDKYRKYPDGDPEDTVVLCLITGCEWWEWANSHKDWFKVGRWSEKRCAHPISLTDAGREALANRHLYDMEDHHGGLVDPGYVVTPAPPA